MQQWFHENWQWFLGLIGIAVKNHWDTVLMKKTIYDTKTGDLRLVRVKDCVNCRIQCQTANKDAIEQQEKIAKRLEEKIDQLLLFHMEKPK